MRLRFFFDGFIALTFVSCTTIPSEQSMERPLRASSSQPEMHNGAGSIIVRNPEDSVRELRSDCTEDGGMITLERKPSSEIGLSVPLQSRSSSSEKPYWFTRYRCNSAAN